MERARHAEPHQFERHRPDGVTLEVRGAPMPGGGFVTSYSDITEIKKSEERVRQQERLFRGAIDAINEAFRDWVTNADNTYYCFGTAAGPHPFPVMVRDFQRVIGMEARVQVQEQAGRLPDAVTACVGGGSNAIGVFHAFIDDPSVRLVGFEAAGDGVETGRHAATFTGGSPGAFQGSFSYLLQDEDGQTIESHSISAGLDYPGVGPEHAYLKDIGRAEYRPVTDTEAMDAFGLLCRTEGIIPAIESAHAVAGALKLGQELGPGSVIVVNLSGRGDKDVETAAKWFGLMDGETGEAS